MARSSWPPQSQRIEPNTSPVRHCEWTRTSGRPRLRSPSTRARAVSAVRPPVHTSRSNPIISNVPHLVGNRVDAIRHSTPACAAARDLFSSVDIGVDLIAAGTDLFGRDGCFRLVEIRRTLLEKGRQRFLGFSRAHALTELLHFEFDGGLDLVDEALLEEPFAGPQCTARFC